MEEGADGEEPNDIAAGDTEEEVDRSIKRRHNCFSPTASNGVPQADEQE